MFAEQCAIMNYNFYLRWCESSLNYRAMVHTSCGACLSDCMQERDDSHLCASTNERTYRL